MLDGPLAFDNAISRDAAKIKGITSEVAGDPDILLAPDLEAGNMMAKQLSFLANADSAGLVLGARVPVILTSRADSLRSRIASCAVAVLAAHARRQPPRDRGDVAMDDYALVFNAGSSSLKFCVYRRPGEDDVAARGARPDRRHRHVAALDRQGRRRRFGRRREAGRAPCATGAPRSACWPDGCALATADRACSAWAIASSTAAPKYAGPCIVTPAVLDDLRALVPLAPLHQPYNLAAIEAVSERLPGVPQVACFDTSFHRGQPAVAELVPLPKAIRDAGVQRYGFHGLSYEYIASVLPEVAPEIADGRVIVAHLGSGASLCAMKARKSMDSTLGFTALDGLCMGTRPGSLDPGVILHLFQTMGLSAGRGGEAALQAVGPASGSRASATTCATCSTNPDPAARLAVDYFVYQAAKQIGALAAVLGGVDALVFTAGIGEHSAEIRRRICEASAWLGVDAGCRRQRRSRAEDLHRRAAACRPGSFPPTKS